MAGATACGTLSIQEEMVSQQLERKIQRAIKLLHAAEKKAAEFGQVLEICYSGGKDSDVILELAKMAGIKYRAIYKNTTIDPKGTIKHAKDMGCEIVRPKKNFLTLIQENGRPNRYARFCCRYLKEYKVLDYAVLGIRREESPKRAKMYHEPERCRVFSQKEKVRQYLPILDWTEENVAEFVAERGVKCHSLYYDEDGKFHPERRLGCMCCPLASRGKRLEQFQKYPNMVKLYIRGIARWMKKHPKAKGSKYFSGNPYGPMVCDLFYNTLADYRNAHDGMFGSIDDKKVLEDYFNIKFNEATW